MTHFCSPDEITAHIECYQGLHEEAVLLSAKLANLIYTFKSNLIIQYGGRCPDSVPILDRAYRVLGRLRRRAERRAERWHQVYVVPAPFSVCRDSGTSEKRSVVIPLPGRAPDSRMIVVLADCETTNEAIALANRAALLLEQGKAETPEEAIYIAQRSPLLVEAAQ